MKQLNELTVADIATMSYNELISIVRETNRVPGGYLTIQQIVSAAGLKRSDRVLEVGTSTGITAIELIRLCGCSLESIDINERSIIEAQKRAKQEKIEGNVTFSVQDARHTNFQNNSFDAVFCGNVTSLIPNRHAALEEYYRVLKHAGRLIAVPMYYIRQPKKQLIDDVKGAIQADIEVLGRDYWLKFYQHSNLCRKFIKDYKFDYISDETIDKFVDYILGRPHLHDMQRDAFEALSQKYRSYIYLFRDNLSHMGFSIIISTKELFNDEPELFTATEL